MAFFGQKGDFGLGISAWARHSRFSSSHLRKWDKLYLKECFEHADHREAVHRFWYLFVAGQHGKLASFAASPSIVFHRVREGLEDPVMQTRLDENDRVLAMRRIELCRREQQVSGTATNEVPVATQHRQQTNTVVAPRPDAEIPRADLLRANSELVTTIIPATIEAGKSGIGIVWAVRGQPREGVDVDLYVRAANSPTELYYKSKMAPWGRYLRDILHASGEGGFGRSPREQWEYVELENGVSLGNISVWVDVFRNECREAIHGLVIVVERGRILQGTFGFPAGLTGDGGLNKNNRESDPHWMPIDIAHLIEANQDTAL